jgi:hypothetical protein
LPKRNVVLRKDSPKFEPIPVSKREGIAPRRGFCSIAPAGRFKDALTTANGTLTMMVYGGPLHEKLVFQHEKLLAPKWKEPIRPPQIAHLLPEVRKLLREGKYKEAALLSIPPDMDPKKSVPNHKPHPAFFMNLDIPQAGAVTNYLRTLNFMTGEAAVHWTDLRGKWTRRGFVSRPDQVAVQLLTAPDNGVVDVDISINAKTALHFHHWELGEIPENLDTSLDINPELMLLAGRYDESVGNIGYACATRVVTDGGTAQVMEGRLQIRGVRSVTLLSRVERYAEFDQKKVKHMTDALMAVEVDYDALHVFFKWIDSLKEDFRENARLIYGCRGMVADIHPDAVNGLLFHFSADYPHHYWVACAGWLYNEFWGHYLVTGDEQFLRDLVIPGLKEIALFFEDFLTDTTEEGHYIFYPSYSPENWPENAGSPIVINALMDIMVCREVLDNLITGCRNLGIEQDSIPKWEAMLDKLPPYLLDEEGALKEWAWPGFEERCNHRHISHLYDVWPGNAITWEDTPELAKAALMSNRKRGQQNDSAHGIMHRAFVAARLKDSTDVFFHLKQILDHGFINRNLSANHFPYHVYFADVTGSFPAFMIEMLVYSSPGVIELLPALPKEIPQGTLTEVCCFTFARINELSWDLQQGRITAKITSLKDQEITLRYRYGVKEIQVDGETAEVKDGNCKLRLQTGKTIQVMLSL